MIGVRYLLPAVVVIGGLVVMLLGSDNDLEGGAGIVSAGLAILFINWLFRVGVAGENERDAEEEARNYFDRHGYWPDEAPPPSQRTPGSSVPRPSAARPPLSGSRLRRTRRR